MQIKSNTINTNAILAHCVKTDRRNAKSHLDVLLQLNFMLPRQLFMLPLELGDQQLPLELLLVLQSHQLLLQLLLRVACWIKCVQDFLDFFLAFSVNVNVSQSKNSQLMTFTSLGMTQRSYLAFLKLLWSQTCSMSVNWRRTFLPWSCSDWIGTSLVLTIC